MRKLHAQVIVAFMERRPHRTVNNTATDGTHLILFGHTIARHAPKGIFVTDAGIPGTNGPSRVTRDRLNMIPGVRVNHYNDGWKLHGVPWDGRDALAVPSDPTRDRTKWKLK